MMRLLRLHIDGFGAVRNLGLEDVPGGLVIFTGDNEAGKTTCLSFIRDVLFGFRDGRSTENNFLPADGGRYGGRLVLLSERLGEVTIERRPGKKGGPVSVSFADGRRGGEETLPQILGATTRDVFRNVYAFSLKELQTIDTLKSEAVKGVLYGAALGASTLNLPSALSSIDAAMGELFKPGGRTTNPLLNRRLKDLEQKREALREARKDIDRYDQISVEIDSVDRRIEELRTAIIAKRRESERTSTLIRLWEDWLALAEFRRKLADLPEHVDVFPEDGLRRLDRLREKVERAEELLRDLRAGCDADRAEAKALAVDEAIFAQSGLIRELFSRRETFLKDRSNLVARRQTLEAVSAEMARLLDDLGAGWTEDTVLAVDHSLFTREAILRQQKQLEECAREKANRANLLQLKQAEFEAAAREEEEARRFYESFGDILTEADEDTCRSLQNGRDQLASVIRDLPQIERELGEGRKRLSTGIKEVGPAWDESQVEYFDCSIAARQKVQRIDDETTRLEGEIGRVADEIDRTGKELEGEEQRLQEAADRLNRLGPRPTETRATLEERKSSLRLLRSMAMQREKLEGQAVHLESRLVEAGRWRDERIGHGETLPPVNLRPLSIVLAAAGVVAFAVLLFSTRRDIPVFAGITLLLASIASYWLDTRLRRDFSARGAERDEKKRDSDAEIIAVQTDLGRVRETLADLTMRMADLAASLSVRGTTGVEEVDLLEAQAEGEVERIREWEQAEAQWEGLKARMETLNRERAKLEESDKGLKITLEKVQAEWVQYLRDSGLPSDLAPRAGNLVFLKVESLRGEINRLRDLEGRLHKMEEARDSYRALAGRVSPLASAMQRDIADLPSAVDMFLKEARETEARQKRKDTAAEALEEHINRRKGAAWELKRVTEAWETACGEEAGCIGSWGEWLAGHGLTREISPTIALDAFVKIGDAVGKIGEKERLEEEITSLEASLAAYLDLGRSLFAALGRAFPSDEKLPTVVDEVTEELEQTKQNKGAKEGLAKKIAADSLRIEVQEKALTGHKDEIDNLLAAAGVAKEDEFLRKGRLFEEKRQILTDLSRAETALRKISGEEDLSLLRRELENLNLEDLKVTETGHQETLQDLEEEREALAHKRAEMNQSMARLSSADDISRLRAEEEALVTELRELAKEWGSNAIARALLGEARRRYEQEQQPKVINEAGRFFREMTGGKYEKVIAPMGEETFEIMTKKGEIKKQGILSTGTLEQLYLAIRFAYITNYSNHTESLPVIMDDVLVNFDPERTENAIKAILALARTHQILYFTCHPETVERFRKYHADAPVFSLSEPGGYRTTGLIGSK